ncbi:hypothetical protein HMPREF0970_00533 [Schaalia odontolytica F0309]|uniref:Uncharacterized protein n=1 Tax=Schaalia odontolytica F0309 TaxID=649742 RepID=D4TX76_9ACTO|nr:hypothetical protein HMPREF0970_00533 [Schaalia odontolytica F0309]
MLYDPSCSPSWLTCVISLNAPFGARCFMTHPRRSTASSPRSSLNAPFGARCFMTPPYAVVCA